MVPRSSSAELVVSASTLMRAERRWRTEPSGAFQNAPMAFGVRWKNPAMLPSRCQEEPRRSGPRARCKTVHRDDAARESPRR
jgi:hypothetical protein